jgi:hypothetical protein
VVRCSRATFRRHFSAAALRIGISRADSLLTRSARAFGPRRLGPRFGAELGQPLLHGFLVEALVQGAASLSTMACGVPLGTNTA